MSCYEMTGLTHREADQIGAQSKSGSLSSRDTDGGAHRIQDGEHDGGKNSKGGNLIKWQGLLWNKDSGSGNY